MLSQPRTYTLQSLVNRELLSNFHLTAQSFFLALVILRHLGHSHAFEHIWSVLVAEVVQQLLAETKELEAAGAPLGAGHTAKAWATQHILQRCIKRGEKLVIFCQYIEDLKDIENGLKQVCTQSG